MKGYNEQLEEISEPDLTTGWSESYETNTYVDENNIHITETLSKIFYPYTQEQLEEINKLNTREQFMQQGPQNIANLLERTSDNETNVEDIIMCLAELLGE